MSVVDVGQSILLDDGLIELVVTETRPNHGGGVVVAQVQNDGELGDRRGVNIPGAQLVLPAMTDLDREHLSIAVELDADFVAASFVRTASDVREIRSYLEEMRDHHRFPDAHRIPRIISKIESAEALQNFDAILDASDGVMVARGDLAVEIPFSVVTRAQKMIVSKCNRAGKPVVVATQMLESMIDNPRPTRAEVSDVVNAVYDGADCVMLSGESAKGKYPVESVRTLARIAKQADMSFGQYGASTVAPSGDSGNTKGKSMARAIVQAAKDGQVDLLIVITSSGKTAELLSAEKGPVPIMAFVGEAKVGRQLMSHRGVWPVYGAFPTFAPGSAAEAGGGDGAGYSEKDDEEAGYMLRPKQAVRRAKELGMVETGDTVLIVLSEPSSSVVGQTLTTRTAKVK